MHRDLLEGNSNNLRSDVIWIKVVSVEMGDTVNFGYLGANMI